MGNLVLRIANGKLALAGPHTVRRHVGVSLNGRPHEVRQQLIRRTSVVSNGKLSCF